MKKYLLLLGVLGMSLSACSQVEPATLRIISPTGAPTLALYNHISELTTNSTPTLVAAELTKDNYDAVVFDFYNGLKALKNNNGHYKLARILTAGNLYLVGINHPNEPTNESKIVSFGENLLPDLAFKELYGSVGASIYYVDGVQSVGPVLKTGKYSGDNIDYVVIAEPVLTNVLSTIEDTSIYTKFSIRDKWASVKGEGSIIPQAGLFINMNSYEADKDGYDAFLSSLNNDIKAGIEDPNKIKSAFESVGDVEAQKEKFGIPASTAYTVTKNGNGVGLVESYNKSTINTFLSSIGKGTENYDDYIL